MFGVVEEEANVAAQIHVLTVEIYFNVSLKSMLSDEWMWSFSTIDW